MPSALLKLTHLNAGVHFFHPSDERAFFEWIERIPCVSTVLGEGPDGLIARLKRRPGKDDLWQFLALFRRYGLDMRQLAKFETAQNRDWFRDPQMFWYAAVFGE
ncbi:MAG: hypothetical protein U1E50_08290 [Caulobacteraceae bacterium]